MNARASNVCEPNLHIPMFSTTVTLAEFYVFHYDSLEQHSHDLAIPSINTTNRYRFSA